MKKITQYTPELKREAVKLAQSSDKSIRQVAIEFGIKVFITIG